MSNLVRIKRRASGSSGAPSSLLNAELAYNEVDDILYYGKGTGGAGGSATVVMAIGGPGAFVAMTGNQTIGGVKTFSSIPMVGTATTSDNSTQAASTAFVKAQGYLVSAGVTPGTYSKVTVGSNGLVMAGANLSNSDITTALGYTPINTTAIGQANGVAGLDGNGKVPTSQLPASITGALNYQGVWNASTNSPALVSGVGTKGYYYKVSVAGTTTIDGVSQWNVGDMIAFDGATWDKINGLANEVLSVAGRTGAVTLSTSDISGLGTMATQNANNVAITGGTIDGITIDGGTF